MTAIISNSNLIAWGQRQKDGEIIMHGLKVLTKGGYEIDYSNLPKANISRESVRGFDMVPLSENSSFAQTVPVATGIHESHQLL